MEKEKQKNRKEDSKEELKQKKKKTTTEVIIYAIIFSVCIGVSGFMPVVSIAGAFIHDISNVLGVVFLFLLIYNAVKLSGYNKNSKEKDRKNE